MNDCSSVDVYGIHACDTCRKAQRWLHQQGIPFRFHDLREKGLSSGRVEQWLSAVGPERLVNRRSTTWRGLDDVDRARALEFPGELLREAPTLIKRPVFEYGGEVRVGFRPDEYLRWLTG